MTAGRVGSGWPQGKDLNQLTEVGLFLASVMRPSGVISWITSRSWLVWAITRLSLGPGSMYMAYLTSTSPRRATEVFFQSSRRSHRNHLPLGSKSLSTYAPMLIGGLNLNANGSASFSKMCFGMMKQAPQRTVKAEWKRELGVFRKKTTVFLSGCSR